MKDIFYVFTVTSVKNAFNKKGCIEELPWTNYTIIDIHLRYCMENKVINSIIQVDRTTKKYYFGTRGGVITC